MSFAEVHAAALRSAEDDGAKTRVNVKGERTEKADGHQYVEIVAGPRNGMFIKRPTTRATARRS